jgi:hypothetical protein
MQIILNQAEDSTKDRPGHGRLFVGLDESQGAALSRHVQAKGVSASATHWGGPTIVMADLDQNELFFWLPHSERTKWPY